MKRNFMKRRGILELLLACAAALVFTHSSLTAAGRKGSGVSETVLGKDEGRVLLVRPEEGKRTSEEGKRVVTRVKLIQIRRGSGSNPYDKDDPLEEEQQGNSFPMFALYQSFPGPDIKVCTMLLSSATGEVELYSGDRNPSSADIMGLRFHAEFIIPGNNFDMLSLVLKVGNFEFVNVPNTNMWMNGAEAWALYGDFEADYPDGRAWFTVRHKPSGAVYRVDFRAQTVPTGGVTLNDVKKQ